MVRALQGEGGHAYLVGGCVRDILLGLDPGDYDIACSVRPKAILKLFPESNKIGIKYGVLTVKEGGYHYQVATFRSDHPVSDGRRPRRIFFSDMEADSQRRDFTVNAVYLDPMKPEFIDPQGGIPDLKAGLLRIIGAPEQRFEQDYLRILRAVRFASRFNLEIESASLAALKKCAPLVEKLSADRIRDEITRAFSEGNGIYALELLHNFSILQILWDIFSAKGEGLYRKTAESLKNCKDKSPESLWAAFFKPWRELDGSQDLIERAMRRLNFPRRWKKAVLSSL